MIGKCIECFHPTEEHDATGCWHEVEWDFEDGTNICPCMRATLSLRIAKGERDGDDCSVERCGDMCSCGHCSGQHHSYTGACDHDDCEKFEEMF